MIVEINVYLPFAYDISAICKEHEVNGYLMGILWSGNIHLESIAPNHFAIRYNDDNALHSFLLITIIE